MSDYNLYDFTINSDEQLLEAVHNAAKYGCPPMVYINGMYYELPYLKKEHNEED